MTPPVHPIEAESNRVLGERVDLSHLAPGPRAVVARVIHASADVEYAATMVVSVGAVEAGVAAVARGAPVMTDVEMVRAAITGLDARCYLGEVSVAAPGRTRAATALARAAERHSNGAIFVIGCAPTALTELLDQAAAGRVTPALVIGLPVGFVGAAEAKARLRATGLPAISNHGEKGGSAVAAAAANALVRLARG